MQTRSSILRYALMMILGIAIGTVFTTWVCWKRAILADTHALEVSIQRDLALLSELQNGQPPSARRHIELFLAGDIQMINSIARGNGMAAIEARAIQHRVKSWYLRNPAIDLNPNLKSEVQIAVLASQ